MSNLLKGAKVSEMMSSKSESFIKLQSSYSDDSFLGGSVVVHASDRTKEVTDQLLAAIEFYNKHQWQDSWKGCVPDKFKRHLEYLSDDGCTRGVVFTQDVTHFNAIMEYSRFWKPAAPLPTGE